MNIHHHPRVRFAPSPSGFMHLGNVRAALINYLFAQQKQGTFILRIEDTDTSRNFDHLGAKIMEDLSWLGLDYQEGPHKNGPYAPYYQSQRTEIYQQHLDILKEKNLIYRCFCTVDELEKKRQRQIALKQPPRYDRTCLKLSQEAITQKLDQKIPFIWRFKLDETKQVTFFDLARQTVSFELKNFSDFALTRQDHSFTFLWANFVDDLVMRISHVFRGEDHLTNTANQVALYEAFEAKIPVFCHLPIMGNAEGKKLSKRDFGFSLNDLKEAGYLPEAICNYLTIIGGGTFEKEIMNLQELVAAINFDAIASTGQVRYDIEKLRWVNHQWIMSYQPHALAALCHDILGDAYPEAKKMTVDQLLPLITPIAKELVTINDVVDALAFYFAKPAVSSTLLQEFHIDTFKSHFEKVLPEILPILDDADKSVKILQHYCKEHKLSQRDFFTLIRLALTGKPQGPGLKDLLIILKAPTSAERLQKLVE